MSKDRLEDIKERFVKYQSDYNLNGEDVEWLIQQAERAKRYRVSIEFAKLKIKDFETDVKMVWKMAEDKLIKRDARQILDDIADTLKALEGDSE